jgi:Holliday junction resolvase RusA-like endonuclease
MPQITLTIPGVPVAQPRVRSALIRGDGRRPPRIRHYTPDSANSWKLTITAHILRAMLTRRMSYPVLDAVQVDRVYVFDRPARLLTAKSERGPIPRPIKPDLDNLDKALFDALTAAEFWADDAQVVGGTAVKVYSAFGSHPELRLSLRWGDPDIARMCDAAYHAYAPH